MNDDLEIVILENLIHNETYSRKVIPFLKDEYFPDNASKITFGKIREHINKYNSLPTQTELLVSLKNSKGLSQQDFEGAVDVVNSLAKKPTAPNAEWLVEHTEGFCKERALYNTILSAAERMEDIQVTGIMDLGDIPEALQDALAITFDTSVGLAYDAAEDRWERRKNRVVEKISFSVEVFNRATNGGMNLKTITCVAAGTGAGKSAFMCAQAAHSIMKGVDTLYITLEMDEDSIADRIDANLLNIDLDDIPNLSKESYTKKINKVLHDKCGKLVIKEYPTAGAGVLEFRALLQELKLKQKFVPKFIVVDYLNICSSARFKNGGNGVNSYTLVKAIAEELRGLAKEFNCAILTGTQLNRDGVDNENVTLKEISESSGLSFTVDMLFALMRTEDLDKLNQVVIKQLKNRFSDMTKMLRFVLGVERAKFKYFDVDVTGEIVSQEPESESNDEHAWSGNFGTSKRAGNRSKFQGINT